MEKFCWVVTFVAGMWIACGLAPLAPEAAAAGRRSAGSQPGYTNRHGRDETTRSGSQANYHADYHMKTGTERPGANPEDARDARYNRPERALAPERYTRPPGWRP